MLYKKVPTIDEKDVVIPGYFMEEKLQENDRTKVYRGWSAKEHTPVIIKVLKPEAANPANIFSFVYEYDISQKLKTDRVVKPIKIKRAKASVALIMEYTGEMSLREYIKNNSIDIPTFLNIALQLVQGLSEIHQHGIVHGNLKPENILIHPSTKAIKIIDFNKAVLLSAKNKKITEVPQTFYEYMSPEQRIHVEGSNSYCIDLYSLGAVFYEILTGQSPLQVACNSKRLQVFAVPRIKTPAEINPDVPITISSIVMKLLSRTPDERYQSAYGLIKDLQECMRQWNAKGMVKKFQLGKMDISPCFELPSRLIGRENEAKALKSAYNNTCKGKGELILISGYAGTGKTKLVNEVLKPVSMGKGYFACGKFDQIQRDVPYAPFVNAFNTLIKQLMAESRNKLEFWKGEIKKILGDNGAVVKELIPNIELIIGKQPPAEMLQPKEALNRFLMVFEDFVKIFAKRNVPLVIFLDDLQWADTASLRLLKHIYKSTGLDYLLIVCAYRDNEINASHPLSSIIKEIRNEDMAVRGIHLNPFSSEEVAEFVAETLHCKGKKLGVLADILYRKTCGNPFFISQMLMSLYREKIIRFNMQMGCWEWETEPINELRMPEDILDFLIIKLEELPKGTLDILKLASCIGNTFDLETLSEISNVKQHELIFLLMPALAEGLVFRSAQANAGLLEGDVHTEFGFEFLHDKVRQSVYILLSEKQIKETHVKIGRLLLENADHGKLNDRMLTAMDHINRGLDLIDDQSERLKFAEYNLGAGRKAKSTAAFDGANNYFKSGMELLPQDPWNNCYELCWALHFERGQCEYLLGNDDATEKIFSTLISQANTDLELADVYGLKMVLYSGKGKYGEAVSIGIDALEKLGVRLTNKPGMIDNIKELVLYKWNMRGKSTSDLLELPDIKHPVQRRVADLFIKFILATCTDFPDLYSFAIIKAGNHALRYGNSEMASIGYIGYSIVEGSILGNYKAGYEFGEAALALADRYDKSFPRCVVNFTFGAIILHWTHHAKKGLEYLKKAVEYSGKAGDVLIAGFSLGVILENKYLMGVSLEEVIGEAQKCISYASKTNHENLQINAEVYERAASVLTNRVDAFFSTSSYNYSEEELIKHIKGDKASQAAYHFSQIQLYYLAGNYNAAFLEYKKVENCMGAIMGFLLSVECNFYGSLVIAAIYCKASHKEKRKLVKILTKNQKQMKKWSASCNENFLHKYLLVEAERMRISGKKQEAGILYDKAIQCAQESGYIQNVAIACELAAKFYLDEGRIGIAKTYMGDALVKYQQWGAAAKIQSLRKNYPELLGDIEMMNRREKRATVGGLKEVLRSSYVSEKNKAESTPELRVVQKAIKNIYKQSEPYRLSETFLNIVTEITCANKGYLIIEKDNKLFIEAYKDDKSDFDEVIKSIPLERSHSLPKRIVYYVTNTLEPVIINNREQAEIFIKDPYIAKSGVKSIACLPLQFKGIPMGVLYIENKFITGAFTKERLVLLEMLSEQMVYAKVLQIIIEQNDPAVRDDACLASAVPLSEREIEVLKLVADGMTNWEIAERLVISYNTVKTHMKNIYSKFQVNRRVQVVEKAKELNII